MWVHLRAHVNYFVTIKGGCMIGQVAKQWCYVDLEVQVMTGGAGYYIGTTVSRESNEFYRSSFDAAQALADNSFTQRIQF